MNKTEKFEETVVFIADKLNGLQYAFRGTTSLVLQGIDMNVDDIDILTDKKTALAANEILKEYLVEKVEYKESDKFKSYFGKFRVNTNLVEVYGEWQIKESQKWSEIYYSSDDEITKITMGNREIRATSVETELSMFAKMGRWNAYHKLRKQVEMRKQMPLL